MFFVPIIYLSGVLIVWILVAIADRRTTRQMVGTRWSTSLWLIAVAALALSLIYASPFGPARDFESAMVRLRISRMASALYNLAASRRRGKQAFCAKPFMGTPLFGSRYRFVH